MTVVSAPPPPPAPVVIDLDGAECSDCGRPARRLVITPGGSFIDHGQRRRCPVGARMGAPS